MVQLLFGLAAIHKAGFAHNDLKPTNILVSKEGIPKIADFGLARRQFTTQGLGTKDYAAPEMFSKKRPQSTPVNGYLSDIWSMGVTFYLMITRHLPLKE